MAGKHRKPKDGDSESSQPITPGQSADGVDSEAHRNTLLDRAQSLVERASNEPNLNKRIRLAKEALSISGDCADAYLLLAEHSGSHRESRRLYQEAVAAGERTIGPEAFHRDAGRFWGIPKTRPYMRARERLAHSMWSAGRREEAVQHFQDMLRLNPNDSQGIRYTLANSLLFLDRDDDLGRLLTQFDDTLASWTYTKALLAFRQHGDTPESRQMLEAAKQTNHHLPAYLIGDRHPSEPPAHYSPGEESEALIYLRGGLAPWKFTPGAIDWLRASLPKNKAAAAPVKGPLGFVKNWLEKNLPHGSDVWLADFRQLPSWIRIGGEMIRPWTLLVANPHDGLILGHQLTEEDPSAGHIWDALVQTMRQPLGETPQRPAELQVLADERWESLRPHLEEIGVKLVPIDDPSGLDPIFAGMAEHISGKPKLGLLDMPGVTPARAGSFFEAAASFYHAAPWKKIGDTGVMKIECGKFQSGPWYAVVMGQSGITTGLALYDDLAAIQRFWGSEKPAESARQSVATTVTFGAEWSIPVSDFDAARRHGWPVAQSDAYPDVFHMERGLALRRPLVWELELVEGCLRAIPEYVNRHPQDEAIREEIVVPAAGEQLKLTVTWIDEGAG